MLHAGSSSTPILPWTAPSSPRYEDCTGTPTPADARLLEITTRDPVLIAEGTTYADGGVPIDYCHDVYRE